MLVNSTAAVVVDICSLYLVVVIVLVVSFGQAGGIDVVVLGVVDDIVTSKASNLAFYRDSSYLIVRRVPGMP